MITEKVQVLNRPALPIDYACCQALDDNTVLGRPCPATVLRTCFKTVEPNNDYVVERLLVQHDGHLRVLSTKYYLITDDCFGRASAVVVLPTIRAITHDVATNYPSCNIGECNITTVLERLLQLLANQSHYPCRFHINPRISMECANVESPCNMVEEIQLLHGIYNYNGLLEAMRTVDGLTADEKVFNLIDTLYPDVPPTDSALQQCLCQEGCIVPRGCHNRCIHGVFRSFGYNDSLVEEWQSREYSYGTSEREFRWHDLMRLLYSAPCTDIMGEFSSPEKHQWYTSPYGAALPMVNTLHTSNRYREYQERICMANGNMLAWETELHHAVSKIALSMGGLASLRVRKNWHEMVIVEYIDLTGRTASKQFHLMDWLFTAPWIINLPSHPAW